MKVRTSLLTGAVCAALVFLNLAGCKKSPPANVAATVNNKIITYAELEKSYKTQFPSPDQHSNDDQIAIQKLEVLRVLIDNEIMLQRAEKLSLMAVDSDVDAKFNEFKAPLTQEELQKWLTDHNMTVEDWKAQKRRDLSIQKLFNKEITSHISITDKDVADFYNANKASFNLAEPLIHMAQILVTPIQDPNVRNLKSDKALSEDAAKKKILAIERRLRQGQDFAMVAQNYSEDPTTALNGGDMGFIPESALDRDKVDPELRRAALELDPGQFSKIIHTQEGYRILKVISREPAGQRELTDPRVQQDIREALINRKDQLLRAAYYEVARSESKLVNYFAEKIAHSYGKTK
jgi:peptidyl-prolyl cis-trans isomerase SurA